LIKLYYSAGGKVFTVDWNRRIEAKDDVLTKTFYVPIVKKSFEELATTRAEEHPSGKIYRIEIVEGEPAPIAEHLDSLIFVAVSDRMHGLSGVAAVKDTLPQSQPATQSE